MTVDIAEQLDTWAAPAGRQRCLQFRRRILDISQRVTALHIASAFSCLEMVDCIYYGLMRRYSNGESPDTFLMSKGHGCMAQYAILEKRGVLPREELDRYCTANGLLGAHPDYGVPGIAASTGSLGHGMAMAVGMAVAERNRAAKRGSPGRIYAVVSDGELQEGSVWEAALSAGKHNLSNLTVLVDYNKHQSSSSTNEVQNLEPLADKWKAFGFATAEVDGHDLEDVRSVLYSLPIDSKKPTAIICHTVKGKGIPFIENNMEWHHKSQITEQEFQSLYEALGVN